MATKKDSKTLKKDVLKNILRSITDFTSGIKNNAHQSPDVGNDLLSWILEDADLRAGLEKKHSKIVEVGWFLTGAPKAVSNAMVRLTNVGFNNWYDESWWQELVYSNSFTEFGTNPKGRVISLNIIKTDEVEIVNLPNGKVTNYLQIPQNSEANTKQVITLPENKVMHIAFNRISTTLWGISDLHTLIPILHKKRLLEDFIAWLFESNQFRSVIKIPSGVNEDDVEVYLEMLKNGMLNPTNFLVLQGDEAQVTALRTFEGFVELLKLLDYYQSQINKALQLPPLEMGNVESSNRSSAEYQVRYSYYSHIKYLTERKAQQINDMLLPKLGIQGVKFIPKITDDVSKKDLLEMGQKLLSLNADMTKLNQWLIDNGLDIPVGLLEPIEEESPTILKSSNKSLGKQRIGSKSSRLKLDKNSDQHPSRAATESNFAGGSRTK